MAHVIDKIYKQARDSEKNLYKLYKEVHDEISASGINEGISDFWTNEAYETDDLHGGEKCIERYGHKVWAFDSWVGSNNIPESKQALVRNGRFPVRTVALWYTPYHYNTNITPQELYEKSETEKILYEDSYVKVTMLRRNVIPFFNSVQWCHHIAEHEYVMYLKQDMPTEEQKEERSAALEAIHKHNLMWKDKEITFEERETLNAPYWKRVREISEEQQVLMEVFHDYKMKTLFDKAKRRFNNWYDD